MHSPPSLLTNALPLVCPGEGLLNGVSDCFRSPTLKRSLVSRASNYTRKVSKMSVIFQASPFDCLATRICISFGSFDMTIGINKVPYLFGDTPNASNPRTCTLTYTYRSDEDFSPLQFGSRKSSST